MFKDLSDKAKVDYLLEINLVMTEKVKELIEINHEAADRIDELLEKCRKLEEKWANEDKGSI